MKRMLFATLAVGLMTTAGLAQAQSDPLQVRSWAAGCANCHGTDGHALKGMPPLAGKNQADMTDKLLAYKNGSAPSTIMQQLAKGYTDEQLSAIAGYFAAQKK
ncbi:c-type cytochrome [Comamonas sp. NLF-1-9]|uniref:c-type cytochrome n=1 Tax=Comamonas sp. NLF-1-9 TaxID=2853163 RepID=UPI001C45ED62|nr:c-type cytochrome [Comamonas sp. NLF-1-9]QXL84603.1 c-type cytochrome [Comamonas sp. NLF-1-9]